MDNIRTGIMRTYDEAARMRENYLAARNRALAEVAMDMANGIHAGETVSVHTIAARAGLSPRVVRSICSKYRYLPIMRERSTGVYTLGIDGNPNGEYEYVYALDIRRDYDRTEVVYAAIGEDGTPNMNNTIRKMRSVPKYGFYRR